MINKSWKCKFNNLDTYKRPFFINNSASEIKDGGK